MSFAYLALYTGDYLRDTRHLTPLRHGVYMLLLMHCWDSRGPVPLDEQECAGIANCRSADEIEALRYILGKYFTRMEDGWYNSRMQREIERAQSISAARSHAGFKGYEARAKQLPSKSNASVSNTTTTTIPTTTTSTISQTKTTLSGKPDVRPQAIEILEYLNANTGKQYRPVDSNLKLIEARLKSGVTPLQMREVVFAKCQQWGADEKMSEYLRPKTLFNSTNFENYLGVFANDVP